MRDMDGMPRIRLRAVEPEDATLMWMAENDAECADTSDYTAPLSRHRLLEYALSYDADPFRAGQLRLIVEMVQTDGMYGRGEAVGIVDLYEISVRDLTAWTGIYISPSWRGRGIGGMALHALVQEAFGRMGLKALGARVGEDNPASLRLFAGAGWMRCGTLPQWRRTLSGGRCGVVQYVLAAP